MRKSVIQLPMETGTTKLEKAYTDLLGVLAAARPHQNTCNLALGLLLSIFPFMTTRVEIYSGWISYT